jgi:hypothetical protein
MKSKTGYKVWYPLDFGYPVFSTEVEAVCFANYINYIYDEFVEVEEVNEEPNYEVKFVRRKTK